MPIIETDILIVGGGIAGATLAGALRGAGYRIVLVEQRKTPLDTARGDHLQPYTVELLARWGLLERFAARGAGRRVGHEFRTAMGAVLLSARYDELPLPHPYFLVVNHELIAEWCLEAAAENPDFLRLQPVTARNFEWDGDALRALPVELPSGERAVIKPHLMVGADGTNSVVRAALGLATDEYQYAHPMVALFGPRPAALQPREYFFRYAVAAGMLVIQPRMDDRLKVTLPVGAEGVAWWKRSTSEERAAVLARRAELLRDFDSELAGFYPVKMIHCREYARGNVVLIGDAAHSIHPARGQGLNIGIQSLPQLIESLPAPDRLADAESLRQCLRRYQDFQQPLHQRLIAANHAAALRMDAGADGRDAETVQQEDEQLRRMAQTPELRRRHLLEAAGYP